MVSGLSVICSSRKAVPNGLAIVEVKEDSAAHRAGLEPGNIITAFDGSQVTKLSDFEEKMKGKKSAIPLY